MMVMWISGVWGSKNVLRVVFYYFFSSFSFIFGQLFFCFSSMLALITRNVLFPGTSNAFMHSSAYSSWNTNEFYIEHCNTVSARHHKLEFLFNFTFFSSLLPLNFAFWVWKSFLINLFFLHYRYESKRLTCTKRGIDFSLI